MNERVQEVTVIDQDPAAAVRRIQERSEVQSLINVIERVALDPSIDIDRLERLIEMQERIIARNAKAAYAVALSKMQPGLPSVERNGKIVILEKGGTRVIQTTPYALWEDINDAIRPHLAQHGFALSFRTGQTPEGKIIVTGILSHAEGHQEETTMTLTHDSTGSKNAVQAVGSSISYGKRYTAGLLLNITSRAPGDADDDGHAAGGKSSPGPISQAQLAELRDLMDSCGADVPKFCVAMEVDGLAMIPVGRFEEAIRRVREYAAKKQQRGAQP